MKFRSGDNRGAAIVELALTVPLFTLLFAGAAELGRIAYFAIEVENAARAGASYGSLNLGNAFSSTGQADTVQAARNDAPDLPSLIVNAPYTYCVCEILTPSAGSATYGIPQDCTNTAITSCKPSPGSNTEYFVLEYVKVDTQATADPLIHIPGLPDTYTLGGSSRLRVLQN